MSEKEIQSFSAFFCLVSPTYPLSKSQYNISVNQNHLLFKLYDAKKVRDKPKIVRDKKHPSPVKTLYYRAFSDNFSEG